MAFEQKQALFKKIAKRSNNFLNVVRTVSVKAQIHFAYISTGSLLSHGMKNCSSPIPWTRANLDQPVVDAILRSGLTTGNAQIVTEVNCNNLDYETGMWIILHRSGQKTITVGFIECILVEGDDVHFVLTKHESKYDDR